MAHQQQLGLGVDPRALRGCAEPGKADLDGAKIVPAGPVTRVPVRGTPDGAAICLPDLREWDESLRSSRQLRRQVAADLAGAGHQREVVAAAVVLGGRSQVLRVAGGQRLEPDQGAFKYRYVEPGVHAGSPHRSWHWHLAG